MTTAVRLACIWRDSGDVGVCANVLTRSKQRRTNSRRPPVTNIIRSAHRTMFGVYNTAALILYEAAGQVVCSGRPVSIGLPASVSVGSSDASLLVLAPFAQPPFSGSLQHNAQHPASTPHRPPHPPESFFVRIRRSSSTPAVETKLD